MLLNYSNIFIFLILSLFLSILIFILSFSLVKQKDDLEKLTAYECGFSIIHGQTRTNFQIHFYVVAMLFLVFDLEILLLFPIAVTLYQVSTFGFSIAIIFFIVLTIGFILEIGSGAISISNNDI